MFHSPHGPALGFLLVGLVFVFAPWVAERLRLPGVIGLLAGGALIGANGFDLLTNPAVLDSFGSFGLLYLMFMAGIELDLAAFAALRKVAVGFGLLTFALPLLAGLAAALIGGFGAAAAVLIGSFWASHTLVTYPEFRRRGLSGNRAVAATVGATIITDTLALVVLAVVAGVTVDSGSGLLVAGKIVAGLAVLIGYCLAVLPFLARLIFRSVGQDAITRFVFTAAAFASAALVAEVVGIEGIVGAFFAGLGLNRLIPARSPLMQRVEFVGSAIFVPAFLVSVGTLVDIHLMASGRTLQLAGLFVAALLIGKVSAALIAGRIFRMSLAEIGAMCSLSLAQAAATLAATVIGRDIGLFGDDVVNAVIVVIVVSVLLSSIAARISIRHLPAPEPTGGDIAAAVLLAVRPALPTAAAVTLAATMVAAARGLVLPIHIDTDADPSNLAAARANLAEVGAALARRGVEAEPGLRVDRAVGAALFAACREHDASLVLVQAAASSGALPDGALTEMIDDTPVPIAVLESGTAPDLRRVLLVLDAHDTADRPVDAASAVRVAVRCAGQGTPLLVYAAAGAGEALVSAHAGTRRIDVTAIRGTRLSTAREQVRTGDLVVLAGRLTPTSRLSARLLAMGASVLTVHCPAAERSLIGPR